MEHLQHGMQRKWERHFRETKTNLSICLMIVGLSSFLCLFVAWPQIFSAVVFDSRLTSYVITDIEDYWTCSDHYNQFIIDKPSSEVRLFSFYVFNLTKTYETMQRGFKPPMVETGPYAFEISSVKYEVYFEPEDSSTVSYKEYSTLKPVTDTSTCQRMYYRMDKNDLLDADPCTLTDCTCKDPSSMVTIINPFFVKFITEEGSNMLLARYSVEIFSYMKSFYTGDFVEAVKAHLVPIAFEEIYIFRGFMKTFQILKTGFDNVETRTTTSDRTTYFLAEPPSSLKFSSCGLSIYGATGCPWYASTIFKTLRESKAYRNATTSDIPYASVSTILRQNSSISFLNETIGFPKWIAVGVYLGVIDFIFSKGSAMITTEELYDIYLDMRTEVATMSFGSNPTTNQLLGTKLMLHVISQHIQDNWIEEYKNATTFLVYSEWKSTSNEVRCSILGHTCVWQWGAMSHLSDFTMTNTAMLSIIDRAKKLNTNPASLYYDGNSASIYDSYMYCQKVLIPNIEPNDCMDIDYAEQGATVTFPAGLASGAENIDQSNATLIKLNYAKKSTTEKNQFIYLGCNISYLMHEVYRNKTTFHDEFVIRYLNKYKYPTYSHNFTVGNWEELGYSQWGGGYVTYALESVFSIYNLKRAGMWYIGDAEYYRKIPEYYSWTITNGHPYLNISNITQVTMLLNSLTRDDEVGVELRHHIMYRATTLIGDNTFQYTDMWYTNEYAYVSEFKQGNFSCVENKELNPICQILQTSDESSASQCLFIQTEIYEVCSLRVIGTKTRSASNWVTNCNLFQPTGDFTCNTVKLFDDNHPVLSKRGLIVEKMMVSFVIDIIMKDNLWCANSITCQFKQSGLFTTISVNQLLFDGYTDASYLKYLDIKYSSKNFTIECLENSYDSCGKKNYYCSYESGIKIKLTNEELVLNSNSLPFQKFYVERFYHFNYSYFLWPEDNNITLALEAQSLIKEQPNSIYSMLNPYYALYPAWDNTSSANEPFLKHYQCQGRYLYGPPSLYNSCITTVNTGKRDLSQVSNVEKFNGNATLFQYSSDSVGILVNGTINEQLPPGLWDSFRLYPYSYRGNRKGVDYYTSVSNPTFFNPIHALRLEMTQTEIESWDKVQRIFPTFQTVFNQNKSLTYFILSRRFQEDYSSWRPYESNYSRDSYGMEYDVPVAMSSVERLAGYPIFIGTPHNYGNVLWGGTEYLQINGLNPVSQEHRSYIDFDPVTGKVLRRASRQQFNLRIERSSLFQILYSGCVSPTKSFTSGYGCYAYVPLFWTEDSRVIDPLEFDRLRDHFYTRPDRALVVSHVGLAIGLICIVIGTALYFLERRKRKRFMAKIYID